MNRIDPAQISQNVKDKYLNIVRNNSKYFSDTTHEDQKVIADFVPMLAWTSEFLVLTDYAEQESKFVS